MRKEENNKKMASDPLCTLPFGMYNESFEHLNIGEKRRLRIQNRIKILLCR